MVFHDYPDYDTYRSVQIDGNKNKLWMQLVRRSHIKALASHLNKNYGTVSFGLCHGTRQGKEQKWFRRLLVGTPDIIGTEISDTAAEFPNTVQWDFHDTNPEWRERADFVHSNSWDHAFDPAKAFRAWVHSLKPGGLMLLDHTKGQSPASANALDPFGATYPALYQYLEIELAGPSSGTYRSGQVRKVFGAGPGIS